jgi:hypothetical protein
MVAPSSRRDTPGKKLSPQSEPVHGLTGKVASLMIVRPTQDLRLFRPDTDMPVLRGTAVTMSRKEGYGPSMDPP